MKKKNAASLHIKFSRVFDWTGCCLLKQLGIDVDADAFHCIAACVRVCFGQINERKVEMAPRFQICVQFIYLHFVVECVCCHKIDQRTGTVLPVDANCLLPKTIFYRKWAKTKASDERDEQGGDRKIGCTQGAQWTRERQREWVR